MAVSKSVMAGYWDRRSTSYTDVIKMNLEGEWENIWASELIKHFPKGREISVLDVGVGPGFYSIILAKRGFNVTAIDFSAGMLSEARNNAGHLAEKIIFMQMDAQQLLFPDNSFDVIVTRNLTWNLPEPVKAYSEWLRVLKPGGVLLNFDANWYSYLFDEGKHREFLRDRENVAAAGLEDHEAYSEADRMERISLDLPMGQFVRPRWDIDILTSLGFSEVSADLEIGLRVWNPEEKLNYASTPGFMIKAVK